MPTPLVHSLLPASCLFASSKESRSFSFKEKLKFTAMSFLLSNSPDLDLVPVIFYPDKYVFFHRYFGHNIFTLSLLIYLGGLLCLKLFPGVFTRGKAFLISACLVGSHVVLDAMAHINSYDFQPSVPLFWPFSRVGYTLPVTAFVTLEIGELPPKIFSYSLELESFAMKVFVGEVIPSIIMFVLFVSVFYFFQLFYSYTSRLLWRRSYRPAHS